MEAFQEHFAYILERGWDVYTLFLLTLLAFVLALWLLCRIVRNRSQPRTAAFKKVADSALTTKVPPLPPPKIEQVLNRLEGDYAEFVGIVRGVLKHTPYKKLMSNAELKRKFAHLEVLLQRSKRPAPKGSLGITLETNFSSTEAQLATKATMLTIIRLIQDVEGVREKNDVVFDTLVDRFLEKV